MKKIGVGPGQTLLINGISGQLGLNAAQLALAMGATKILGTGRNQALLDRVKALAPRRIDVLSVPNAPAQGVGPGKSRSARGLGQEGDRRPWRRRHDRLPAARRAGEAR